MTSKTREELLDLIPAYAIGGLDADDLAAFETWLEQDAEALTLLDEYRAAADHLVMLAPLRPAPGHLQADLRQRLAASQHAEATQIRRLANQRTRWLLAAALAAVVILGIMLVWAAMTGDEDSAAGPDKLFADLKSRPGTSEYAVVPGDVSNDVWGKMLVASDGKQAVLCVWDLPAIGNDETFQMWLIGSDGARTSGGLFRTSQNVVYLHVPFERPIAAYQGVGVSLEPAGGSPFEDKPTGPRILSVPLG